MSVVVSSTLSSWTSAKGSKWERERESARRLAAEMRQSADLRCCGTTVQVVVVDNLCVCVCAYALSLSLSFSPTAVVANADAYAFPRTVDCHGDKRGRGGEICGKQRTTVSLISRWRHDEPLATVQCCAVLLMTIRSVTWVVAYGAH